MAEVRRGLGYNGELLEPLTRALHLGGGLRVYSPVAIRFHSPDRLSPFGAGGLNAYAYCNGDPINRLDPSGRFAIWVGGGLAAMVVMGAAGGAAIAAEQAGDRSGAAVLLGVAGAGLAVAVAALAPALACVLSRPIQPFSPMLHRFMPPSSVSLGRKGAATLPRLQVMRPAPTLDFTGGRFQGASARGRRSATPSILSSRLGQSPLARSRTPGTSAHRQPPPRVQTTAPRAAKEVRFSDKVTRHYYRQRPYSKAFLIEASRRVPADLAEVEWLMASRDPADDYIKVALAMDGFPL